MSEMATDLGFLLSQRGDLLFYTVLLMCVFAFLGIETLWILRKLSSPERLLIPKEHAEMVWSVIPALVLLCLTLVHQAPRLQIRRVNQVSQNQSYPTALESASAPTSVLVIPEKLYLER